MDIMLRIFSTSFPHLKIIYIRNGRECIIILKISERDSDDFAVWNNK
jgi:hypothetical protein